MNFSLRFSSTDSPNFTPAKVAVEQPSCMVLSTLEMSRASSASGTAASASSTERQGQGLCWPVAKKVIFLFEEKTIPLDCVQNYDGRRSVKTPSLGKV